MVFWGKSTPDLSSKNEYVSVLPADVAESEYIRFGHVGPAWEQKNRSMTAYSEASVDRMGTRSGVSPRITSQLSLPFSYAAKPSMVGFEKSPAAAASAPKTLVLVAGVLWEGSHTLIIGASSVANTFVPSTSTLYLRER